MFSNFPRNKRQNTNKQTKPKSHKEKGKKRIDFVCLFVLFCFCFSYTEKIRGEKKEMVSFLVCGSVPNIYGNLLKAYKDTTKHWMRGGGEFWNMSSTLLCDLLVSCPCGLRFFIKSLVCFLSFSRQLTRLIVLWLFFCLFLFFFEIHSPRKKKIRPERCDPNKEETERNSRKKHIFFLRVLEFVCLVVVVVWRKKKNGPVIAILADHLLVPSRTDCLTAFMWPLWLRSSTPNTALYDFITFEVWNFNFNKIHRAHSFHQIRPRARPFINQFALVTIE